MELWPPVFLVLIVVGLQAELTRSMVLPQQCHQTTTESYRNMLKSLIEEKQNRFAFKHFNVNTSICNVNDLEKPVLEKEPQRWMRVSDRNVMVFSAFYERRPDADGPSIRIIATGWQQQFNDVGDLYCHLWYKDTNYPVAKGPALYHRIYPSTFHSDMWVSHFIICKLPVWPNQRVKIPYAVSIVPKPCVRPENALKVLNRKRVIKGEHALCISPVYGFFKNWTMIAEMIELHKLLGAEEITMYIYSAHSDTDKLLEQYAGDPKENINVVDWRSFPPVRSNVWCQRGALNDCLYRMGHKYKYVTITDLDEVLVPRATRTWPELMKRIAKPQYGAYLFQHAYFRRNVTDNRNASLSLITQTSFWRTDVLTPPGKIRSKSMYEAKKTVSIDLHFPYLLVPGAKEYILQGEEGMLHHYRMSPMETFAKKPQNYRYIEDRYLEKFKEELVQNFASRVAATRRHF